MPKQRLYGERIQHAPAKGISLSYFLRWRDQFKAAGRSLISRPDFLDKLTGSDQFRIMLEKGWSEAEIRDAWKRDLDAYKALRARYLLYP
ncbi:MAG: DUF1343 domain-containing protein [Enterobacterales bacterium]|nr:DUF1343 domain-containing protein [Enterobacterales bacterium]